MSRALVELLVFQTLDRQLNKFNEMADLTLFMLVRLLLPFTLIVGSMARPVLISTVYLVTFFISPWLLQTKTQMQRTMLHAFLIFLCVMSAIFTIGHLLLNLIIVATPHWDWHGSVDYALRHIGFVGFFRLHPVPVMHWMLPDFFVFNGSLAVLVFSKISARKVLKKISTVRESELDLRQDIKTSDMNRVLIIVYIRSVIKTSPLFSLIVLYFAATLRPSLPGSLYFLMFIVAGTYWALYRPLHRGVHYPLIFMAVALTLHIICLFCYQLPVVQYYINSDALWVRVMGMEVLLVEHTEDDTAVIDINTKLNIDSFISPAALMLAYFVTTLNLINRARYVMTFTAMRVDMGPKETMGRNTPPSSRGDFERRDSASNTNMDQSLLEQFFYLIYDITSFIYENSYILLNIIMMIWSIVYHSWLTFVLLIWANILWMIPNQRRSMLRSSFFVVLYAEFLLITQYIYGMNIHESELPTQVASCGVNLEQIGFSHPQNRDLQPCVPLAVKTAFLFVFWVTSRQYFKEKAEEGDESNTDLFTHIFGRNHSRSKHTLFEKSRNRAPRIIIFFLESLTNFITRIWMWMLIFLIFLCAMFDTNMTGFRICYMSLFLLFLMVFQMSLQLWFRFLYGYWIFLIFYAMSILTVIYTYQFDHFDQYWEYFLKIQPALQSDIGLRRYQTSGLFLHLLIPTLTVIFTVVQLHYFHQRFMDSVRRPRPTQRLSRASHIVYGEGLVQSVASHSRLYDPEKKAWIVFFKAGYRKLRSKVRRWFRPAKLITWRFLEMHMIKAVILASFYCAVSEVCFFNLALVVLSLVSVSVTPFLRRILFRVVTFWVSILVLMKMIYQISYLDHAKYDYICKNETVNFASWMGLHKTTTQFGHLMSYISPYIIYMIITSLHAVVKLRDHLMRYSMGELKSRKVLFPESERLDAERDTVGLFKYLLNYGFYKFGIEITLIALAATITHRRDVVAMTYLLWFILVLCLTRVQCFRIWDIFQLYIMLSIFLQYLYILNFPPNLCIAALYEVPNVVEGAHSIFYLLPQSVQNFYKSKLMLDFIVLMFIARQRKAFKFEMRQMDEDSYPGGDNKSVVHNIAKLGHVYFDNPTHDFCSYVRNYADVIKTAIFCSFFWVTLAVVFMAGVCSVDVLSLGYLIFALVFLLQGSDVYLQNIHYILCRWNSLIAFNVVNIVLKVIAIMALSIGVTTQPWIETVFHIVYAGHIDTTKRSMAAAETTPRRYYGPRALIFKNALVWHAIVFAFAIFQLRILRSYYFCHIITDTQANAILASRGAAVIESLHYKQIYDRREYEKNVLENLKAKMERIRATNRKNYRRMTHGVHGLHLHHLHGMQPPPREPKVVKTADVSPSGSAHVTIDGDVRSMSISSNTPQDQTQMRDEYFARAPQPRRRDLRLHPHAVRTGDYYMFDELDERDERENLVEYDFLEKEEQHARQLRAAAQRQQQKIGYTSVTTLYDPTDPSDSDEDYEDFDTHPVVKLTLELIVLITLRLNRVSRNYRFVHKVLSAEKKTLQEITTMNRLGLTNQAAMFHFLNKQLSTISANTLESNISIESRADDFVALNHNDFVKLLIAIWYAIIANTEVICYLVVFVNQAANSSVMSLPMPLLVLFWGALSLPRPTKTFWVTLITYTLAMIFIKCILNQNIAFVNDLKRNLTQNRIELYFKHGNAIYDLLLLVVLFWHRYMLKKQGIWDTNKHTTELERSISRRRRPVDILKSMRQEGGADTMSGSRASLGSDANFDDDFHEVLRPTVENKYAYRNIETEYYRRTLRRLDVKGGCLTGLFKFFLALRRKARLSTDVYALLFVCDFINFFVLLFGFPKFAYRHKYTTSVIQSYIQENKVPISFLMMLLVQFLTIVTERAIYLRKALVYKIAFYIITVAVIHIWMFFLVPYVTGRGFGATAHVVFYMIKCLHMLLSAYQIRCGYPKRILGNVFTKSYSLVNLVVFKIYLEIPFLYILRTMLDWVCIETTLTLMEWIKMEDIFQSVFIVRCYRQMDTDFPVFRGEPKPLYVKLLIGGTIILLLILLIWSPLFLFALVGTVGTSILPNRSDITVKIGHYEPMYVSQSYSGVHKFTEDEYKSLLKTYEADGFVTDNILVYDFNDVASIKFDANSLTVWNMSPPDKKRLLEDLKKNRKIEIRISISIVRGTEGDQKLIYDNVYTLTKNKEKTREMLIKVISDDNSAEKVIVPNILPKFIMVRNLHMELKVFADVEGRFVRPFVLQKKVEEDKAWWELHDYCDDEFYDKLLEPLPDSDCKGGVVLYTFNDKEFPPTMNFIAKAGIIGLYTTFVFLVSRIIRSLIANNHRRIMFEDLPYVDRVLKLCYDIYLVREALEYRLEEDLYGKLLFLYRSPETLIKWTRFKDDVEEVSATGSPTDLRGQGQRERRASDEDDSGSIIEDDAPASQPQSPEERETEEEGTQTDRRSKRQPRQPPPSD